MKKVLLVDFSKQTYFLGNQKHSGQNFESGKCRKVAKFTS